MSSSGHSSTTTNSTSTSSNASSRMGYHDHGGVYPTPPPPTTNRLSTRQKAQLRRSTSKLAKVLGEAPQVVDQIPSRIAARRHVSASAPKKLQPSLSITSTSGRSRADYALPYGRVARSASLRRRKVDPELYPLSSTLRPASCDVVVSRVSRVGSRGSSESKNSNNSSRRRSRSMSSEFLMNNERARSYDGEDENDERSFASSFVVVSRPTRIGRPQQQKEARPDSTVSSKSSRDSLLDYEPAFSIPSANKMKREKMARVCKLLGEDVPVHLVFPMPSRKRHGVDDDLDDLEGFSSSSSSASSCSSDEDGNSEIVSDICPSPTRFAPPPMQVQVQTQTQIPPPVPPKPKNNMMNIKRKPVPKLKAHIEDGGEPVSEVGVEVEVEVEMPLPHLPPKALPTLEEHQSEQEEQQQQEQEREQEQETRRYPALTIPPAPTAPMPTPIPTPKSSPTSMPYRMTPTPSPRSNLGQHVLRLETIIEQSPRTSYSSHASSLSSAASSMDSNTNRSRSSMNSLWSTTTSSSYRFTSSGSGCLSSSSHLHFNSHSHSQSDSESESSSPSSSPTSTDSHTYADSQQQKMAEMSSGTPTHGRREFAIYVPFRRNSTTTTTTTTTTTKTNTRQSGNVLNSCQAQFASAHANVLQERESVRGIVDLRV